ncbi:dephospho-CoA kinase [Eubacterium ruminantium]|nr:dephospho-CoA kinase [Eubacterium ruminantium]
MMQNDRFIVLGITGGIGSGKSKVLEFLSVKNGCYILEADKMAHLLMSYGTDTYIDIVNEFGRDILNEDMSINRKKLGDICFNKPAALQTLNDIVHPAVKKKILSMIRDASKKELLNKRGETINLFCIEAALLIESGYKTICDYICYIYSKLDVRLERLEKFRGIDKEKSLSVIKNQKPDEYFRKNSNFVIDNSLGFDNTIYQIEEMLQKIL